MNVSLSHLTGHCPDCGSEHKLFVKDIIIEKNALLKLPAMLEKYGYTSMKNIFIVCDDNTYDACGKQLSEITGCKCIILSSDNLHANEIGVELLKEKLSDFEAPRLLIACGSGTIHDLTRYVAYTLSIDFVSVPTAASVDGFVSTVAAMTWYGFKKSLIAVSPVFVIADTLIFSKAPYRLTASGVSDMLGKYTALCDWKIGALLTDEIFCQKIYDLEYDALNKVIDSISGLKDGNPDSYENLMYGLILSGLAMQMIGNSRPASGAEHHMSHLWEMHLINDEIDYYHGEKVSVGLLNCVSIYNNIKEQLLADMISFRDVKGPDTDLLKQYMSDEFAQDMIKENTPYSLDSITADSLYQHRYEIAEIIEDLPAPDDLYRLLRSAGCACLMEDIGLDNSLVPLTAKLAPYVRNRVTLLKLTRMFI